MMSRKMVKNRRGFGVSNIAFIRAWQDFKYGAGVLTDPDKEPVNRLERRVKKSFERKKK